MCPLLTVFRNLRRVALVTGLIFCAGMAAAQTTTITGKVYSPNGPTAGDPLPNILVYVAQTAVQPFTQGVAYPGQGCSAQPTLVSGSPLVEALTAADGSFTLTSSLISGPVNLVIQAGKWRRQYPNTAVTVGGTTSINLTMPGSQSQGDLPHIAVVTGAVDAIECIFPQIGISSTEFTDPSGGGSINLFKGDGGTGLDAGSAVDANSPSEASLVENTATLNTYDLVLFGCRGTANDSIVSGDTGQALENLVSYTSSGGRIMATHYGYVWIDNSKTFPGVANWITDQGTIEETGFTSGEGVATIDQSYNEGAILAAWLQDIGGSYNNTLGQVLLTNMREDEEGAINPPAQSWVSLANDTGNFKGNPSLQFTFDTPIGATGTPTVSIGYSNSTTLFQPGDPGDSVTVDITNNGTVAAQSNLTLTITLPGGLTATSLSDPTGGWICTIGSPSSTCGRTTALNGGVSDNVTLTFSIASTATPGSASITSTLSGGGLSNTGQCGRVLYNDYHVETPGSSGGTATNTYFPKECPSQTTLTNTQKFLEFSLYNLSNFISPSSIDVIVIEGTPTITWATPAAIPYGAPLTSTQLDATATYNGSSLAGTYVYTPPAGTTTLPLGNNPATNTLSVVFTPTDTTDYTTATGSVVQQVVADTTTVVVTSSANPAYYGESVTLSAATSTNGAVAAGQTMTFYDGLTAIGTGTTNAQGVATYTTSALIIGNHNITACMTSSADFNGACSASLLQLVTLVPTPPLTTSTMLTTNVNPALVGQNVTFTVNVATTGAFTTIPGGTVTFNDGTTALGTAMLNASGYATFGTSTLAAGTHTITAVYAGTATLATSTSNTVLEVVLTTLPTAGNGFLLTVSPLTLSLGVGASQAVNVSVLSLNNYQEPINLTCTGAPTEGSCVFGNAAMPVGGGATTLTISVAGPHACGSSTPYFVASGGMKRGAPWMAAGLLGLLVASRRKRLRRWTQGLTLALALCCLPMLGGCAAACTDFGVQPGTYAFTVTATPTAGTVAAQSQTIIVTVHL
jgi:hypothetical protein